MSNFSQVQIKLQEKVPGGKKNKHEVSRIRKINQYVT